MRPTFGVYPPYDFPYGRCSHGVAQSGQAPSSPAPVSQATANYYAQLNGQINGLSAEARTTFDQNTSGPGTAQAVETGANATASLVQNGYDPSNPDDNQKLINVIAGGLALTGPTGLALAGAVELMWTVGNVIACPISNAFAAVGLGSGCDYGCHTSGNWTPATVLAGTQPPMPQGSFAQLVMGALAYYASQQGNCQGGPPPDVVVDAVVAIWNQTHQGPAEDVFVPPLTNSTVNVPIVATGNRDYKVNGVSIPDPNITFAFQPVSVLEASPYYQGGMPTPFGLPSPWIAYSLPRTVSVNTGPLVKKTVPYASPIYETIAASLQSIPPAATASFHEPASAKLYLPALAGIGAALYFSNPLLALAGIGLGLLWNRR